MGSASPAKRKRGVRWVVAALLGAVVVALACSWPYWGPPARSFLASAAGVGASASGTGEAGHAHPAGEDGGSCSLDHAVASHPGHDDASAMTLSEQAAKNVGLKLLTIEVRDFDRTITVPAVVVDRPGRGQIDVSAPLTGIVIRIHAVQGETVVPGKKLFDLRLLHEDLVKAQGDFLQTVEQLDVIDREITRLEGVAATGAVAGRRVLEQQYEKQKTEATLHAQEQALILHGLSNDQVERIRTGRVLLKELTVSTPGLPDYGQADGDAASDTEAEQLLQMTQLDVRPGQHVAAGERLCTLADRRSLFVEGRAFEQDSPALNRAIAENAAVSAILHEDGSAPRRIDGLHILYIDNQIETESRVLRFYTELPNEVVRDDTRSTGLRFVTWRFKPGQRVELLVPVGSWKNRIVLPVDAVVRDDPDWFVFQKYDDHFDRRAVHVEYRDQQWAVLASDGTLFPGDVVAGAGAHRIHEAMKNQAAGGVDPHAGHSH